jgi:hypothetical protein
MNLIYYNKFYKREEVEMDNKRVYLFGDNLEDMNSNFVPKYTQAVIRGLPNAIGIPTKKNRFDNHDSYFNDTDEDFKLFKKHCDNAIMEVINRGCDVVFPTAGIGTGAATIRGAFSNPDNKFLKYLNMQIQKLNNMG